MAIKEFWIQIENRTRDTGSTASEYTDNRGSARNSEIRFPANRKTGFAESRFLNLVCALDEEQTDDIQSRTADALVLRRYKPPRRQAGSDAWTFPVEPIIDSAAPCEPESSGRGRPDVIRGPLIECHVGDRLIVHFRNNDRRNRIVTKTIEVDLPFGGPIALPTPFNEPVPPENRTHGLRPDPVDGSTIETEPAPLFFSEPMQAVGFEVLIWGEVGVWAFKQGDRVPPGGTFTYVWEVLDRARLPVRAIRPVRVANG
jgi:hypothetical protein